MSERFQILDLVEVDDEGVLFQATDLESGGTVSLRRFFPFGRDGGGLEPHEQREYLGRLPDIMALRVPGLRRVVGGGCDEVDGLPWLAMEWIEGERLSDRLAGRFFEPGEAVELLDRALAVCQAVSATRGVDGVWVDLHPAMVVWDSSNQGRGFTFGISAVRWLMDPGERRNLLPFGVLAGELMGWKGRVVADHAGDGLGAWVHWLKDGGREATLTKAKLQLASFTGRRMPETAMPVPTRCLVPIAAPTLHAVPTAHPAPTSMPMTARGSAPPPPVVGAAPPSRRPWAIAAALAVAVLGTAWWGQARQKSGHLPHGAGNAAREAADLKVEAVNRLAEQMSRQVNPGGIDHVFTPDDSAALLNELGKTCILEGTLRQVRRTSKNGPVYLLFADASDGKRVHGRVPGKLVTGELGEEALKQLEGKKIRITGKVERVRRKQNNEPIERPEIIIDRRAAITDPA